MAQKNQFDPQLKDHAFSDATTAQPHRPQPDIHRSGPSSVSSFEEQRVSARLIGQVQEQLTALRKRCRESAKSTTDDGREQWFKTKLYEGNSLLQQARGFLVGGNTAETNQLLNETQQVIRRIEASL
ncbi:MAG: hypothetical protein NTZ35_11955 [Ignavibacteriales bacterium]|nr:hypothetical protein [Ignavibacteriales bacterium]